MRIIFAGSIGRLPFGGHAWVDMQYLIGLRELGHDVFYVEECGAESWVYHWQEQQLTTDLAYPGDYVRDCLGPIGFGDKWIYRAGEEALGMTIDNFRRACSTADLMLIRAVPIPLWRPEYDKPKKHAFIDMDPLFTQIHLAEGHKDYVDTVDRCDRLFTIGQRITATDCSVPTLAKQWLKTVPPIALSHWPYAEQGAATHFSSVMQWKSYKDVVHAGMKYGNKDREFPQFADLPHHTSQPLLMALTGSPPGRLTDMGWEVSEGWIASRDPQSYQEFIQQSRAEFGIAKHGYVASRCGWFSDRSVCYLASGRPVLVQDTGLDDWLPIGEGVLTFHNVDQAIAGIEQINADYQNQRRAARNLAETIFATSRVLPPLLDEAMS